MPRLWSSGPLAASPSAKRALPIPWVLGGSQLARSRSLGLELGLVRQCQLPAVLFLPWGTWRLLAGGSWILQSCAFRNLRRLLSSKPKDLARGFPRVSAAPLSASSTAAARHGPGSLQLTVTICPTRPSKEPLGTSSPCSFSCFSLDFNLKFRQTVPRLHTCSKYRVRNS